MSNKLSTDKIADLWVQHSNKMWRAVYATPVIAVPILVAWYALASENQIILANIILGIGTLLMLAQYFIIRRMGQYDGALFEVVNEYLPNFGAPLMGLSGKELARYIPLLLALLFLCLLFIPSSILFK